MAHNKLRRDLEAGIASACPNITDNTAVKGLLERALVALGGPVQSTRPEPVIELVQHSSGVYVSPTDPAVGSGAEDIGAAQLHVASVGELDTYMAVLPADTLKGNQ